MEPSIEQSVAIPSLRAAKAQEKVEHQNKMIFGFWVYIMTDCVLFASLFATYAVLHNNVFGGPSGAQLFNLPYVLGETMLLLASSFACGLASISLQNRSKTKVIAYFILTFLLGLGFILMEINEFHHLVMLHDSWRRSGFLSAYFTLVGTHGLHVTIGLIWMAVMVIRVLGSGLTAGIARRLKMLAIFWHFLDVVWIFIFTIVYLFGALRV